MKAFTSFSLFLLPAVLAHQGHGEPAESSDANPGESNYAQRHMATEHHIDSFDLKSFFQLHDLNRDGVWDREEIEAIYGVHHVYSQKKSKDDVEHQKKADRVVESVLKLMDKDDDGKITPEEFEEVGLKGLPSFAHEGAEGHHYDVESEFFLHHEEEFHSTPETQTDEAYNHPEDIEHFAQHEAIELKEAEKEAKFQGITVEEALKQHEPQDDETPSPPDIDPQVHVSSGDGGPPSESDKAKEAASTKPKITRLTPPEKQEPAVKYKDASMQRDKQAEWGSGDDGYKSPTSPSDKMRKNLPYKYKFRRSWGDF
jgi:Ca2+-binding EF-hand superfamily protein